jgi:tetratricopeptide (TPR) repeat protein
MKKTLVVTLVLVLAVLLVSQCARNAGADKTVATTAYLNHHDTVGYVGIKTCQSCHSNVHQSFIKTGMGQSFAAATRQKSIARLHDTLRLYDPHLDLYYQPYWQKDSLFIKEYRLSHQGDTTHLLNQRIDYVVGSGQHTNSHIFRVKDHLYQAPFTWYAQKGKLDLPPGYEQGGNVRFSRKIGLECMSCHNAMPTKFVTGSSNKFTAVNQGIDCERCHGPGEAHVKKIMAGQLTDTSKKIDPSIVNPKKLPTDLQFEVCQRCHLQGNTVLKPGKNYFDFKPGMYLKDVMEIYLPRYTNADDKFIMASHVDRFKQSACFLSSEKTFNCTSCHNPHLSVKATNHLKFNQTCQGCHSGSAPNFECTAAADALKAQDYNCVACHMPSSGSIDIPHVTVHDHYIRKPQKTKAQALAESEFIGLYAVNNPKPSARSKALAYLQQFEKFEAELYYLDSANYFIEKMKPAHPSRLRLEVYLNHLEQNYQATAQKVMEQGINKILEHLNQKEPTNAHAWTAYRIGEAFKAQRQLKQALQFYNRAVALAPGIADFKNKQGTCLMGLDRHNEAYLVFTQILKENPRHKEALNNAGFLMLKQGQTSLAKKWLQRAVKFYPDYELAYLNLATLAFQQKDQKATQQYLKQVIRINPNNVQARQALQNLKA